MQIIIRVISDLRRFIPHDMNLGDRIIYSILVRILLATNHTACIITPTMNMTIQISQ